MPLNDDAFTEILSKSNRNGYKGQTKPKLIENCCEWFAFIIVGFCVHKLFANELRVSITNEKLKVNLFESCTQNRNEFFILFR